MHAYLNSGVSNDVLQHRALHAGACFEFTDRLTGGKRHASPFTIMDWFRGKKLIRMGDRNQASASTTCADEVTRPHRVLRIFPSSIKTEVEELHVASCSVSLQIGWYE